MYDHDGNLVLIKAAHYVMENDLADYEAGV